MGHTPDWVHEIQGRIWRAKPFEERMRIGARADALALRVAKSLATIVYPGDPAGLFLLIHGDSFSPDERERIASRIRAHFAARAS